MLLNDVAVHLQLVSNALDLVLVQLDEFEGITIDDVTSDVLLQKLDDVQSLSVHLD